jgi:gliding motility-associated-like protein
MRKQDIFLLLLICTLFYQPIFSQKTNNTWYFGYHGGLDFNTSPPTGIANKLLEPQEPPYYTSTISDTAGKLLFFTDGYQVWNKARKKMAFLNGRWPWTSSDNVLPLICRYPGNDSLYYVFMVGKGTPASQSNGGSGPNAKKLLFVTINIAANGNTGGIVYPQPPAPTNYFNVVTENAAFMLAGTAHCNQKDTWIATISDGVLKNFLVTAAGVNPTPVISNLPVPQSALTEGYSVMKFSANGEKLVIPISSRNQLLVFDFNNQTGSFSNPMTLQVPNPEILSDFELSVSGKKLYYGSYINDEDHPGLELHNIYQLDLDAGSAQQIEQGRYRLNPYPDRGGCPYRCYILKRTLQLGPDGKIYISLRVMETAPLDNTLNVIEFPEQNDVDAYYRLDYVDVKSVYKFVNVSYIRSASFSSVENGIQVRKKICLGMPTAFSLLYSKVDSVKWDFGDPSSAEDNYSREMAPAHFYQALGQYTVKAIIYKACHVDTAVTRISIDPDPIVQIPAFIKDTVVCIGNKLNIDAATPSATTYRWSDGLIYSYRTVDKPGDFIVRAYNACSNDQRQFSVSFEECPCEVFIPSAFTPNNDGRNDNFRPVTQCNAMEYEFKVFNRYGNIVFSSREPNKGWNGKDKGNFINPGVYIWMVQFRNPNNKSLIQRRGTVTLIR